MKTFAEIQQAIEKLPNLSLDDTTTQSVMTAMSILSDLNEQNQQGENTGMLVMSSGNYSEANDYVTALHDLIAKGVPASAILEHLSATSAYNLTTINTLAFHHPYAAPVIKNYLNLLTVLKKQGITTEQIIAHLNQSPLKLLRRLAVAAPNRTTLKDYFDFLDTLNLSVNEFLKHLIEPGLKCALLIYILQIADPVFVREYFVRLNKLLDNGADKDGLLGHLTTSKNENYTIGLYIARNMNSTVLGSTVLGDYIDLLCRLIKSDEDKAIVIHAINNKIYGINVINTLLLNPNKNAAHIFKLIKLGLTTISDGDNTPALKAAIIYYINTLASAEERTAVAKEVLTPESPLWKFLFRGLISVSSLIYCLFWINRLLIGKDIEAKYALQLLNMRVVNGETLGIKIFRHIETEKMKHIYFDTLLTLLNDKDIQPSEIIACLNQRIKINGNTIGMQIAAGRSTEAMQYIILLHKLLDKDAPVAEMMAHITLQNEKDSNKTLGSYIFINQSDVFQNSDVQVAYLGFLYALLQKGASPVEVITIANANGVLGKLKDVILKKIKEIADPLQRQAAIEVALGIPDANNSVHQLLIRDRKYDKSRLFGKEGSKTSIIKKLKDMLKETRNQTREPWAKTLPDLNTVCKYIASNQCDFTDKDKTGVTFKDFIYQEATRHPFILYHLLLKNRLPMSDFKKFSGMQVGIYNIFMHEDMPGEHRERFLCLATSAENNNELYAFMKLQKGMQEAMCLALKKVREIYLPVTVLEQIVAPIGEPDLPPPYRVRVAVRQ